MIDMKVGMILPILNEEDYVRFCIESVKDIIDQLVVCDLGCTDDSIEIIKRLYPTAEIFKLKDKDDYALARNECVRRLDTEWVLRLDADEVLAYQDGTPLTREKFHALLRDLDSKDSPAGHFFTRHFIYNYFTLDARNNGIHFTSFALFKKDIFVKYANKMHEIPIFSVEKKCADITNPIIWHFGMCKGPESFRKKYAQGRKIAESNDIPFKKELLWGKDVNEYCANHDLFRGLRPLVPYYGKLPSVMKLW